MSCKVSIIILVTNKEQYDRAYFYIKKQSIFSDIEVLALDNLENKYKSASKGLNYGASIANGDVLVFMHQDLYLFDNTIIEKYYNFLQNNQTSIIGLAGVNNDKDTYSDLLEGKDKVFRSHHTNGELIKVDTVDECMFAMNKNLWRKIKFDEKNLDNWHLYAADICLMNTLSDGNNYVLSSENWHESKGNNKSVSFERSLEKIIRKYTFKKIKKIHTCCANEPANIFLYRLEEIKKYMRNNF